MAMKEATLKKRAAAKLRKAHKFMNDEGAHWTQGFLALLTGGTETKTRYNYDLGDYVEEEVDVTFEDEEALRQAKDPKECQFCSIGGVRMACFGVVELDDKQQRDPVYITALAALVARITRRTTVDVADSYGPPLRLRPEQVAGAIASDRVNGYYAVDGLESAIINWNDSGYSSDPGKQRSWREIERGFLRAAESLEA